LQHESGATVVQGTQNIPAGAFESNVVHYDVEGFEALANKFCANNVSSLLVDVGETYHGQLSQDWALRGNRTASIYSVIQCASTAKTSSHWLYLWCLEAIVLLVVCKEGSTTAALVM
jgi:hypothetical protein